MVQHPQLVLPNVYDKYIWRFKGLLWTNTVVIDDNSVIFTSTFS